VALVDAYWPAAFATQTVFAPTATVSFALHLTEAALSLRTDAPLFYRARSMASAAGYQFELRELWSADGQLIALNPQTFVVIVPPGAR